jgi:carboxymethylenebutenolidase
MDGLTDKEFKGGVSRRGLVVGSLGVGFALSVQPVMAQNVITTSTDGLEAGEVKIKTADIEIPAYRAMPKTGTNFPTVLVVQEIWGVHEYIKDVCRRLAKAGYFAIAPELYVRQGDPMKAPDVPTIVREIMNKVPDKQVMADLDATVAYAKGTGKADTAKLGITGFCWGGRMVWLYAAHNPNLKAGVAWYGRMVGQPSEMMPKHPIDLVQQMNAAMLGLYGGADTGIPVETVQQMEKALSAANKKHKFVVYPNAPHAFHADYRPSFVKEAAEDGWKQALAWFKANGVG